MSSLLYPEPVKRLTPKDYPEKLKKLYRKVMEDNSKAGNEFAILNMYAEYHDDPKEVDAFLAEFPEETLGHMLIGAFKFSKSKLGNDYWMNLSVKLGYSDNIPFAE